MNYFSLNLTNNFWFIDIDALGSKLKLHILMAVYIFEILTLLT